MPNKASTDLMGVFMSPAGCLGQAVGLFSSMRSATLFAVAGVSVFIVLRLKAPAHRDSKKQGANGGSPPQLSGDIQRVLILMSRTGGGHSCAAQALKECLEDTYQDRVTVTIVDLWTEHGVWPFSTLADSYKKIMSHTWAWAIMYHMMAWRPVQMLCQLWVTGVCWDAFRQFFWDENPDLVISVHPVCQHLPLSILRHISGGQRTIPFVTVVTDLASAHPVWFHPEVDLLFAPSTAVRDLAISAGLDAAKVRVHGLPVRRQFLPSRQPINKQSSRRLLGLDAGAATVLVVGGAEGVGELAKVAEALVGRLSHDPGLYQVILVCGRNQEARRKLQACMTDRGRAERVLVYVEGYVNNMHLYMGAADCIITKAGSCTLAEAMVTGLPIMLMGHLPGQEAGNIALVQQGGMGDYSTRPDAVAETVSGWLRNPEQLSCMARKALKASRADAASLIVQDLGASMGMGAAHGSSPQSLCGNNRRSQPG